MAENEVSKSSALFYKAKEVSSSPEDETSDLDESSEVRLYFWILM